MLPKTVDAPDPRNSTFEAPGPDRARHRADVGVSIGVRAWLRAARPPAGQVWPCRGSGRREPELFAVPAPTAASQSTDAHAVIGLSREGVAPRSVTRQLMWEEYRSPTCQDEAQCR